MVYASKTRHCIALLAICAAGIAPASAQGARAKAEADYAKTARKVLWKVGQRHVKLGMWARKIGLNAQATEQFMLVREASDGINTGGDFLLSLQRQYGEKFWKQHQRASKRSVRAYEKRAKEARTRGRKDRFGLAGYARRLKMKERATKHYESLLRTSDEAIAFDKKGRIPLDCGTIPADYAEQFHSNAIAVDGKEEVRDEVLLDAKEVEQIYAAEGPKLRVRSELSTEHAAKLHKMLSKLLPHLEEAMDGTPVRKLEVFVFKTDASFQAYLQRIGYGDAKVHGLMDPKTFTALVSAEKRAPAIVQAIAMHELAHLYDYSVSRAVFPAWYTEAFAETYGGVGTFRMDKDDLVVGGPMPAERIAPLLAEGGLMPLEQLLGMGRDALLTLPVEQKLGFYTQAWAFLRYLRTGAGEDVAVELDAWEARCRGEAIGAQVGKPRARNASESAALFQQAFAGKMRELEAGFATWLEGLAKH